MIGIFPVRRLIIVTLVTRGTVKRGQPRDRTKSICDGVIIVNSLGSRPLPHDPMIEKSTNMKRTCRLGCTVRPM